MADLEITWSAMAHAVMPWQTIKRYGKWMSLEITWSAMAHAVMPWQTIKRYGKWM